jgi:hypothetical protein
MLLIIFVILALIISEYLLLTELLAHRRVSIIIASVAVFALSTFLILRFWKKNVDKLHL